MQDRKEPCDCNALGQQERVENETGGDGMEAGFKSIEFEAGGVVG